MQHADRIRASVAYFESVNEYKDLARINREMFTYIIAQKERIVACIS